MREDEPEALAADAFRGRCSEPSPAGGRQAIEGRLHRGSALQARLGVTEKSVMSEARAEGVTAPLPRAVNALGGVTGRKRVMATARSSEKEAGYEPASSSSGMIAWRIS